MDQPHVFMQEIKLCEDISNEIEFIRRKLSEPLGGIE